MTRTVFSKFLLFSSSMIYYKHALEQNQQSFSLFMTFADSAYTSLTKCCIRPVPDNGTL